MKTSAYSSLAIVFFICLSGCAGSNCTTKVVQCPAFNDSTFLKWFPYSDSQKIIFRNLAQSDTISISSVSLSASFTMNTNAAHPAPCYSTANIFSKESEGNSYKLSLWDNKRDSNYSSVYVNFENFTFTSNKMTDTGFSFNAGDTSFYSKYYSTYIFNGTVYCNVQTITKADTLSGTAGKPYRIYFARGKGIIGYDINASIKQTWTIQ